tara:strand:- start:36 stop:659 length:624 start_codon:yes stop_codon:yes gene_type:complete
VKLLLERWKQHLNEQRLPQIYCDMDGVLVDFESGVVEQLNKDIHDISAARQDTEKFRAAMNNFGRDYITIDDIRGKTETSKIIIKYMYSRMGNDADIWAHLPWMPGGEELWDFISPYKPSILTTPMQKGSEIGKAFWINENLHPEPINVFMSGEKYTRAISEDGAPAILIDDWSKNIIPWNEAGGIAIQHKNGNTAATIATLKKLGF